MHARKQYLAELRKEYPRAGKAAKTRLLNEAERRTKLNRKYVIRRLNGTERAARVQAGPRRRQRKYGVPTVTALARMWRIFDYPCGQRLAPALRAQVDRLRSLGELICTERVAEQLRQISPKTIDRLLAREKRVLGLRRNRNPGVRRLMFTRVPVKVAAEWDTQQLGNVQVDFVAHCGRSSGGSYLYTLSAVDIASGWWEGEAIPARSQQATVTAMECIRPRFPFRLKEVHPDNDSAMINDLLWDWCANARIRMSRSRPYKKNDNAWIEQKNWTHVRKVIGYRRYDTVPELQLIQQIYAVLRLYKNFFQPTLKLASKVRVEGRIKRVYEQARTPYERLMASRQIAKATKEPLQGIYDTLNPAHLRRQLDELRSRLEQISLSKAEVKNRPAPPGPALTVSKWRRRRSAA